MRASSTSSPRDSSATCARPSRCAIGSGVHPGGRRRSWPRPQAAAAGSGSAGQRAASAAARPGALSALVRRRSWIGQSIPLSSLSALVRRRSCTTPNANHEYTCRGSPPLLGFLRGALVVALSHRPEQGRMGTLVPCGNSNRAPTEQSRQCSRPRAPFLPRPAFGPGARARPSVISPALLSPGLSRTLPDSPGRARPSEPPRSV
jgi:hypothetical protein